MSVLMWSWAFFPLIVLLGFYVRFKLHSSKYWARKSIPHLKPVFILGNTWRMIIFENLFETAAKLHLENREKKAVGLWVFDKPQLLVMDVQLAKKILIKDFHIFRDRGIEINTELDPLNAHLLLLKGKKWRNLRVKLTPTFSSGKLKAMLPIFVECGLGLENHLKKMAEDRKPVEIKDLMARFTTDVISSCAFGLASNSLENPNSEFRKFGKQFSERSLRGSILITFAVFFPAITKLFPIRIIPKEMSEFFVNIVRETVEYREKNNVGRNDFLQLLIQLIRAGKVEDADRNPINDEELDDETLVQKFSLLDAAAQCFVFFQAGFETSSSALTFALYELALNPDIQKRLQTEIDQNFRSSEVSYEAILGMEYLDMVVQETLRKHAPAGRLVRVCNTKYHIPELNATLDEGTTVMFSIRGFHHDPELFPCPERFDPERFLRQQNLRDNIAFMPFGHGPRNCIGNRFALLQVKIGLISVLRSFDVQMAATTPTRVKLRTTGLVAAPANGMPLTFTTRSRP